MSAQGGIDRRPRYWSRSLLESAEPRSARLDDEDASLQVREGRVPERSAHRFKDPGHAQHARQPDENHAPVARGREPSDVGKVEIGRDEHRLTPLRLGEDPLVRLTAKAEVQDVLGLVARLAQVARQRAR